jgi:MinD superfamily P-loop ATPase
MNVALIDPRLCQNCDNCCVQEMCPKHAVFREDDSDRPWIDFYKCSGCMKCKLFCEYKAVLEG